ncbi:MAG TPA: site-specific DNA-methyltransferase [Bacteroidales bacterium]|nr:site-specific DNA-methyltransferase [Bacteroidales bacterium]
MSKEEKITNNIKVPNKDLETLRINFPHCFDKDGNFQLEKFKANLTEKEINFSTESYGLDWLGKSYARLLASDPATTLLKADETHNSKPENANSENLLIKGDNLEVLKHLANAYYEQVKMIYIDPPYNTGGDGFVYEDDRKFTIKELQNLIGIDVEKAKRILDFTKQKSNSHSAWLTFMYPRLYIAKQLLKEDGVIFVSIDDNEIAQLRLLMDEVFGEENFVALFSIENNPKGRKNSDYVSITNDYVLAYSKQKDKTLFIENIPKNIKDLTFDDESGKYIHNSGKRVLVGESSNNLLDGKKSKKHYSVYYNQTKNEILIEIENDIDEKNEKLIKDGYKRYVSIKDNSFIENTYTSDKLIELFNNKALQFSEDKIFEKNFNTEIRIKSLLTNQCYDAYIKGNTEKFELDLKTTSAGTYLKELFNTTEPIFPMSKNVGLIKILTTLFSEQNITICDFFGGSGTTGDAVMQLNALDGGNRKFILVQIPEPIDPKKNKVAYDFVKSELKAEPTIFEITKERIIRASKRIKTEIDNNIKSKENEIKDFEGKLDLLDKDEKIKQLKTEIKDLKVQNLGFKIFETTPIWEDYDFEAEQYDSSQTLFDVGKLTEEDIKTLLVTWKTNDNISLSQELEIVDLGGYTAFYGSGKLYLLHKNFTTENLKAVLEKIDTDKTFNPTSIIAFGYHFESKSLRELSENVKQYANKKKIDIDFITRY